MKIPRYPLSSSDKFVTFEFISERRKGIIHKFIRYQPTIFKNVYNLAFGDRNHSIENIDDMVISNNGDSEKVLATVVETVYKFTNVYPEAWIYATGSTRSHTRLYRMGITKFLSEVVQDFELLGQRNEIGSNLRRMLTMKDFWSEEKEKSGLPKQWSISKAHK